MVTAAERLEQIRKIPEEERKNVVFVQPSKKPKVEGVRRIDPETGELGQSIFQEDFPETEFRAIEDPAIVAARARIESKTEREFAERQEVVMAEEARREVPSEEVVRYY